MLNWKSIIPVTVLAFYATNAVAVQVTDDLGHLVTLEQPAQRIISLAPHVTENLFAAGAGDLIVGTVGYNDYPAAATTLPVIGGYNNFDIEAIVALQPDLIIAWKEGNPFHQVEKLMQLGLTVYVNAPTQLEDISADIIRFGILAGRENEARTAAQQFNNTLAELRQQYSTRKPVSVFYQVWDKPLITVTDQQFIGSVIRLCGGSNIFADLDTPTPQVSEEAILKRDPQVIIASGMTISRPDWLDNWKKWPLLKSVKYNNLFFINPDIIQRHTPRILLGARQMCEALEQSRKSAAARADNQPGQ